MRYFRFEVVSNAQQVLKLVVSLVLWFKCMVYSSHMPVDNTG